MKKINWQTIKAELHSEWKYHRFSNLIYIYGIGFLTISVFSAGTAYRNNILFDPFLTQMISLISLGGVTYLMFARNSDIYRNIEIKKKQQLEAKMENQTTQ